MKYLDYISPEAKRINAVNTIVNKDGKLYGYNTDYYGFKEMLRYNKINIKNKKVMILGTGGTSSTASYVCKDLNCKSVVFVSRNKNENTLTYDEIESYSRDIDILINTTPVEMYPNNNNEILSSLNSFSSLKSIIDVIYNPLNTNLVLKGNDLKVKSINGLYMLIAQAVFAIELFLDKKINKKIISSMYQEMIKEKENIVLIGMPSSGKSTIGKKLSFILNRTFIDIDDLIVKKINMLIKEYFEKYGEESFRNIESEIIQEISKETSLVISTGGGSILRKENIDALKRNGKLFFLDRAVNKLLVTSDRPLSSSKEKVNKLYQVRYPLYLKACDIKINANKSIDKVVKQIERRVK